jgi:hypothetical protein
MTNSNVISQYRSAVQRMLAAFADCRSFEEVMDSQGGASSMFDDADFSGANADLDAATFTSIVVSREAVEQFTVDGSHYTNLNKALN